LLGNQLEFGDFGDYESLPPSLVEIPLLSQLFKFDLSEREGESLLIMLTPTITGGSTIAKSSNNDFTLWRTQDLAAD